MEMDMSLGVLVDIDVNMGVDVGLDMKWTLAKVYM